MIVPFLLLFSWGGGGGGGECFFFFFKKKKIQRGKRKGLPKGIYMHIYTMIEGEKEKKKKNKMGGGCGINDLMIKTLYLFGVKDLQKQKIPSSPFASCREQKRLVKKK